MKFHSFSILQNYYWSIRMEVKENPINVCCIFFWWTTPIFIFISILFPPFTLIFLLQCSEIFNFPEKSVDYTIDRLGGRKKVVFLTILLTFLLWIPGIIYVLYFYFSCIYDFIDIQEDMSNEFYIKV